jgi:hypothetical protein
MAVLKKKYGIKPISLDERVGMVGLKAIEEA